MESTSRWGNWNSGWDTLYRSYRTHSKSAIWVAVALVLTALYGEVVAWKTAVRYQRKIYDYEQQIEQQKGKIEDLQKQLQDPPVEKVLRTYSASDLIEMGRVAARRHNFTRDSHE